MEILKNILNKRRSLSHKMLFYIFITLLLILGGILTFITIKSEILAKSNARELAQSYSQSYARFIQDKLNRDMSMARAFGYTVHGLSQFGTEYLLEFSKNSMKQLVQKNPAFLAAWISWEKQHIDTAWNLPYGRKRITTINENGQIKYINEQLNLEGDNVNSAYYKIKKSKQETIINPYLFSYTGKKEDEILETSLCIPILKNNKFIGLAGMDIGLEVYQDIINELEPLESSKLYLIANNATFVTHPDTEKIGSHIAKSYKTIADSFNIAQHIKEGEPLNFEHTNKTTRIYALAPIKIGKTNTPWTLMLHAPLNVIMKEAHTNLIITIFVGIAGLLILLLIVWIISVRITRPIRYTTKVLQKLAKGNLDDISQLNIKSNDELQDMAQSLNTLMNGLQHTAEFARSIGEGKLDQEYKLLSENDSLGRALLDMQQSLKKAMEDEKKRKEEEKRQNWITEGLAKFGDILRKNNDNLKELSYNIMKNLVNYTEASQGCIYVRQDDDNDDNKNNNEEVYKLTAAIAYDRRKLMYDTIKPGDGLIGRVVHEKQTIYMTDIPEDYVHISSGLGGTNPKSILIVPLVLKDEVFGAFELVSFNEFQPYQIDFVEKIAENIASTVSGVKVTERTNKLLKESQNQRKELSSQEEEMRQQLEELNATQEEANRREGEMNALIDALGSSVLISEYDAEGKVQNVNKKCIDLLGIQPDKIVGKYHKSLGLDNTTPATEYKKFWSDLNRGRTKKRISEVSIAGKTKYIEETYIPVTDNEGNIHKIVGIGYDFTKVKEKEEEIKRLRNKIDKDQ